jgi:hypothetical protein
LSLEAQKAAVRAFFTDSAQLLTEYMEIESEKKTTFPTAGGDYGRSGS